MAELRNEFSWSKSRAETFASCPRQYFYQYYGAWGGWDAKADPRARTLYVLKQLQSRQQWMGATVHNCLRWVLTTLRDKGTAPGEDAALRATGKRMQVDFQNSGEGLYWEKPKETCGLLEHEYDDLEVADDVWTALFEKALTAVTVFYRSDIFQTLRALPRENWLDVEKLGSFDVDGIKVWVQLDCAFRAEDEIRIVDWKTGKTDAEATRLQLALYAWYASRHWAAEPGQVSPNEFNLGTGEWVGHRFTADDFKPIHERIVTSASAMRALLDDAANNRASEENFALSESDKPCRKCPFRRVCPKWADAESD